MELPLTMLRNGETGVIISTDPSLERRMCRHRARKGWKKRISPELCVRRLTDLGLTPGTHVTVIKSAPFNGPLEVHVRRSRLALGRRMAEKVLVEVER